MKAKGRLGPIIIIASACLVLVAVFFLFFEIKPRTILHAEDPEVRDNPYYALELWLEAEEIPVRRLYGASFEDIASGPERLVIAPAHALEMELDDPEILRSWVEGGGRLLLFFSEPPLGEEGGYQDFLEGELLSALGLERKEHLGYSSGDGEEKPQLDRRSLFRVVSDGHEGPWLALVESNMGEGHLLVTGKPWFLINRHLRGAANAGLAWSLTGGRPEAADGILILLPQTKPAAGLGRLFRRGWWPALAISLALLFAVFLWYSLPGFGPLFAGRSDRGPGIGERLRAEARFLARGKALDAYLSEYRQAVAQGLRARGHAWAEDAGPPPERVAEISGLDAARVASALSPGGQRLSRRAFLERMKTLETILERL